MSGKIFTLRRLFLVALLACLSLSPAPYAFSIASPKVTRIQPAMDRMPIYFVENRGQVDPRVSYYVPGSDKVIYFGADGLTFAFTERRQLSARQAANFSGPKDIKDAGSLNARGRLTLKLDFVDANVGGKPQGADLAPALISYFRGEPTAWQTGLHTYTRLVYTDLWPGIDLVYSGTVNRLKYKFLLKPGADPKNIRLRYRGADSVTVNDQEQLEVRTALGGFHDDKPTAYQENGGRTMPVTVAFDLQPATDSATRAYGFRLGSYDATRPLIIDPAILVYAGFVGGSGDDRGNGIAVDASGNAYITGETSSTELTFTTTVGPDLSQNGAVDAFVAKVDPTGASLIYVGFIGGSGDDRGNSVAVDASGNAYITGETNSTETSFPVLGGPELNHNGGLDAFVAKVNASGTALVYSGFVGGSGDDKGKAIAVKPGCVLNCNAYITGETNSLQATFPVTGGPDLTQNGGVDAFVAEVKPDGSGLVYAGYIGGSGDDRGNAIAVDAAGNAYITGETNSAEGTFPDGDGFGALPGADQTQNGGVDAFVAKVNPTGSALVYAGYIGGTSDDRGHSIVVDAAGNAFIAGETSSTQSSFPVAIGPDLTHNGGVDAFVAEVNPAGNGLVYAGYIGGAGDDRGKGIALDPKGDVYVTGETNSSEITFPDQVGPDPTQNLGFDAFVAKICSTVCLDLSVMQIDAPDPVSAGQSLTYTITVDNNGPSDATGVVVTDVLPPTVALVSATPSSGSCSGSTTVECSLGGLVNGGSATITVVVTPMAVGNLTNTVTVTADQTDTDASNNISTEQTLASLPNLLLATLRAPSAVAPGAMITIDDTTTNHGLIAAAPSTTRIYLSMDGKVDAADVLLLSRAIPALAPKQSDSASTMVAIPPGTAIGRYFLIGVADADNVVAETNNTNKRSRTINVTLPDMTVSALRLPAAAAVGATIAIQETTTNKGLVDAGASATRYFLSSDSALDGGDVLLGGRVIAVLAAKAKNTAFTNVAIPPGTAPGKYFVIAVADADGAVAETVESNNTRSRVITLTP